MSSIADALKRAQEERQRLHAPDASENPVSPSADSTPSLASVVLHRNRPAAPSLSAHAAPAITDPKTNEAKTQKTTPLSDALRQSPLSAPPAVKHQQQAADTIVEDYTSKRRLSLPSSIVVYHDRSGHIAGQYRKIRDTLMQENPQRQPQTLVLTSTRAGEGKTTSALNLALSLAEIRANRVLLIDGCLHSARPASSLSHLLHLAHEPGLAELLVSPSTADSTAPFLKATPWHNLFLLPAGARTAPAAAANLLQSPHLRTLLKHLRANFQWILIDSPPAGTFPDAGLLGASSDALLLTLALHHTPHAQAQAVIRRLRSMNLPIKSCILTHA